PAARSAAFYFVPPILKSRGAEQRTGRKLEFARCLVGSSQHGPTGSLSHRSFEGAVLRVLGKCLHKHGEEEHSGAGSRAGSSEPSVGKSRSARRATASREGGSSASGSEWCDPFAVCRGSGEGTARLCQGIAYLGAQRASFG